MRVAAALALAVVLAGCGAATDDEAEIRRLIEAMSEALESGDVRGFMAPVAEDFTAGERALDRRALRLIVQREVLARRRIGVNRLDTEIELEGADRARARFRALVTGASRVLPDEARVWTVQTGWRRDGPSWRLISASWTSSG